MREFAYGGLVSQRIMSKKTAFRFFVADGRRCSLTWSLTIKKDDIYVSHSGSHHDKISLHASGSYQWSVRSEHVASVPFAHNDRHIARWNSPIAARETVSRQFFVLIPDTELQPGRARPLKKATHLPAPPKGWATRVDFLFFTPPEGKHIKSAEWTPKPIFEAKLSSGRLLLVIQYEIPIDVYTAFRLDATKELSFREAKNHEKEASRALVRLTDGSGVSGMAEVLLNAGKRSVA